MPSIRLFHAVNGSSEPLAVTVSPSFRRENLLFGELTDYTPVSPDFHTVTVIGANSRHVYLQKTLPFFTPQAFTLAIINGSLGADVILIPD